jgi:hypothetical protein
MAAKSIHVVPSGDEWAVRREGEQTVLSTHPTQEAAEEEGRRVAREDKVEFQLHGRDGRIRLRDSYGNDPTSSKG